MSEQQADPFNAHLVFMPLVRILRDGHLSWAQRQEIAGAIQTCLREHRALMAERAKWSGADPQGEPKMQAGK